VGSHAAELLEQPQHRLVPREERGLEIAYAELVPGDGQQKHGNM
jgi:hypothetical protein